MQNPDIPLVNSKASDKEVRNMAFYKWEDLKTELITPKYSTASGPTIHGEKIEVGLLSFPARTEAKPHSHPNEQFMIVLKGRARWNVAGEEKILGPIRPTWNIASRF
jgi:quercetin dioxygenase-like cupin family protein